MESDAIIIHPDIQSAARRLDISPTIIERYQCVFDKCADWTVLNNKENDEYSLAEVLYRIDILDKRGTSRRMDGMFRGHRIEFRQSGNGSSAAGEGDG
jgi:hypothetical protein